jgi:hypothetical protein
MLQNSFGSRIVALMVGPLFGFVPDKRPKNRRLSRRPACRRVRQSAHAEPASSGRASAKEILKIRDQRLTAQIAYLEPDRGGASAPETGEPAAKWRRRYVTTPSMRTGSERHGRAATFAEHNLTPDEEAQLLDYLQFIRSRKNPR